MNQTDEHVETGVRKKKRNFGYIPYPGIAFNMGERRMISTVVNPVTYVGVVGPREAWDPLEGTGTNRKEDTAHRDAIATYIEEEENYVLNSIVVYIGEEDAYFEADDPDSEALINMGTLYVRPNAKFIVGDGGHRTSAFSKVVEAHRGLDDAVFSRLQRNGQPLNVVLDDDRFRRAQDFTDLQKNAKPLNSSVAQSMDRRQLINQLLVDECIKGDHGVPALDGNRIEFLSDSPGKLSAKLMGYKTLRYATGTMLIGTASRSTRVWEENVSVAIGRDFKAAVEDTLEFWQGFSELPEVEEALQHDRGVPTLRADTWLTSSAVIYAIAAAVGALHRKYHVSIKNAIAALDDFDFTREGGALVGTVVDDKGKAVAGRAAWEAAGERLRKHAAVRLELEEPSSGDDD